LQPLDLINTPLNGNNLIEASAGTGKTYTIEGLFLRLILEKKLAVEQILVVTFTKAATEELRDRIRTKLLQAETAFRRGTSKDNFLQSLLQHQKDHFIAIDLIHDALVEFDKASIFTIHGFCARILYEHAFETANLFDTELISDQTEWVREVAEDFWRKNFYDAPPELISFYTRKIKGPGYLWQLLNKMRAPEIKIIPRINQPALKNVTAFRKAYRRLKDQWSQARDDVVQVLGDPALSAVHYGSLESAGSGAGMTKRDIKIRSMIDAMERYVAPKNAGFPLFENFENFTDQKIKKAVKKNHLPPSHRFFETCDEVYRKATELQTELENHFVWLKTQLFDYASTELRMRKADKNIQFFDDLLVLVKKALTAKSGTPLAEAIRQKYRAALVDEFQDTDDIQYEIFSRLFSSKDSLLFMIGDPKQAIYGFRGADIFSYLKAARHARAKFTLPDNWRSQPTLISAVNTIFSNVTNPFIFKEIPFEDARPGGERELSSLTENKPPLTLWYLDSRVHAQPNKPITKTEAVQLIGEAVAEEICRILTTDTEPWQPGDIAVLVRTNRQAQLVKSYLSARRVPAVLYSTGNIFDSREAMELEKILLSISTPSNPRYLKAALSMDMLSARGETLFSAEPDTRQTEYHLAAFHHYFQVWRRSGFMAMFRLFLTREKIRQRLLAFPDGERRLTNVLHLAEILHQESIKRNLGITGLLKWLVEQRKLQSPHPEEHQLRLESDERAVKIVTIHKSKGLQYPVVFCPYGWEGSFVTDKEIVFHQQDQADSEQRLTLDLGSDAYDLNRVLAQNELLAENVRLLYVALTRAKSKCYLVWGRIKAADSSALAYLLHGSSCPERDYRSKDPVAALNDHIRDKSDEDRIEELNRLADKSEGSIEVLALPQHPSSVFFEKADTADEPVCRKLSREIDRTWKVSSYSSLVSKRITDIDEPDRDAFFDLFGHLSVTSDQEIDSQKSTASNNIFGFPKGSHAGNFFHELFEHLDYTYGSTEALTQMVQRMLVTYGFDRDWQPVIDQTVSHVLNVSLKADQPRLTLASIPLKDRINELEFYFPLNPVDPQTLLSVFRRYGNIDTIGNFPVELGKLAFSPATGFMKGYIDLVFQHAKRFYLVDWKSNYLGPTLDSYRTGAIRQTMQESYYILQYHLYVLALCQYLRQRKPAFRYESDFGGVFYLFIRGVDSRRGPQFGIYDDRPQAALINALGKALIPGFADL
jgi:exodeoxyribonuclease V beta subunit